jgi:hypothetical protein
VHQKPPITALDELFFDILGVETIQSSSWPLLE